MKVLCELLILAVLPVCLVKSKENSDAKIDFSQNPWHPPASSSALKKEFPLLVRNESKLAIRTNVFNGEDARKRVPFLVSIVFVQNGHAAINCGGSILDSYHVLTAAHCISNAIYYSEVWIAPYDLDNFNGQRIRPYRYAVHPFYNGQEGHYWYDIAIIELADEIRGDQMRGRDQLQSVCVGTADYDNRPIVLAGFGRYDGVHTSRKLLKASGRAFGKRRCIAAGHPDDLLDSQICAQLSTSEAVAAEAGGGDSGGPLYTTVNSQHILVGIVSYGYEFSNHLPNLNLPGTYTLAGGFTNFIRYYASGTRFCNY